MKNKKLDLTQLEEAAALISDVMANLDHRTRECGSCKIPVQTNRAEYQAHKTLGAALKRVRDVRSFVIANPLQFKDPNDGD